MKQVLPILCLLLLFSVSYLSAQECGVIYISPNGVNTGIAGTRSTPASLDYGLSLVSPTNKRLWLASGIYTLSQTLVLQDSLHMEGGFDPITWVKSNTTPTILFRDSTNILASANALIGLRGDNVTGFRLQDIQIETEFVTTPQTSTYGLFLNNCSSYMLVRTHVRSGNAGAGADGQTGADGVFDPASNGASGAPGNGAQSVQAGGTGGTGTNGNNGGAGAPSGRWQASANTNGSNGLPASCGGGGGQTGNGPSCSAGCVFGPPSCGSVIPGQPGIAGGDGSIGGNGLPGSNGSIVGLFFIPGLAGGNGSAGTAGCGGGGGGGGGGRQDDGSDDVGGSGGGGGGGGQPGQGGTGGTGGGSSFGLYLVNDLGSGNYIDCAFEAGTAGTGGQGGAGGQGAAGGQGGQGGTAGPCGNSFGGAGGAGGRGGDGGMGGTGTDGWSYGFYNVGDTAFASLGYIPNNPYSIQVQNQGCVNSIVEFSATSSGTWDFGSHATPTTATGTGPFQVRFDTLGHFSISLDTVTFTDFIEIYEPGLTLPSISSSLGTTPMVGCMVDFNTSVTTGTYYQWIFGNAATPDTVEGPAATNPTGIMFDTPGSYTVQFWITTECCGQVFDSLLINVIADTLNVNWTASIDTICDGDLIDVTASSGYSTYDFYLNNTLVQSTANPVYSSSAFQQGDSLYIIASNGVCITNPSPIFSPTVYQYPIVSLTTNDPDSTICEGETLSFTASPSTYDIYDFFDNGQLVQSGSSNIYTTDSASLGSTYTVIATIAQCVGQPSNPIPITVNPVPSIALASSDPDTTICDGDAVTLTATPNGLANYDFYLNGVIVQATSSNQFTSTTLVNGDSLYAIATSAQSCVSEASNAFEFIVNPIPSISLTATIDTICEGETVGFLANPGGYDQYEFLNGSTSIQVSTSNSYTSDSLVSGNSFTVIATDLGCVSPPSNIVAIIVNPVPAITLSTSDPDTTICEGEVVSFTAAPSGWDMYDFYLNDSLVQSSALANWVSPDLANGDSIHAIATSAEGCVSLPTSAIPYTVHPIPTATLSANTDTLCEGEALNLQIAPAGHDQYEFFDGITSIQLGSNNTFDTNSLAPGTYTFTSQTTHLGCISPLSNAVQVVILPEPTVSLASTATTICEGDPVIFTASPGTHDSYEFFLNGQSIQNSPISVYNTDSLVNGDVLYVIATNLGCTSVPSSTINMTVNPIPTVSLSVSDTAVCDGTTVTFTASPSGYDNYTFLNNGSSAQSGGSSTYAAILTAGNQFTLIATDIGCSSSPTNPISVIVNPIPLVNAGTDMDACLDIGVQSLSAAPTGGNWSGAGITGTSFSPPNAGIGTHTLTYTYTDANGCGDSDQLDFTVYGLPTVVAGADVGICQGRNIALDATATGNNLAYQWSPSAGLSNATIEDPIASPNQTTSYSLTVTDINGCTAVDGFDVVVSPSATPRFLSDNACLGELTAFANLTTPSTGVNYVWDFGDGGASSEENPSHIYESLGSYTVRLITSLGTCVDTVEEQLSVHPLPIADFSADPAMTELRNGQAPVQFRNLSMGGQTFAWDFGDGQTSFIRHPEHIYTDTGSFDITLITRNEFGCWDTASQTGYIRVAEFPNFYIPNAFTPNGDGFNDVFFVRGTGVEVMQLFIYNRWGQLVFQTNDLYAEWDGTFKDKPVPTDVYVFKLRAIFDNGTRYIRSGSITVLR